MVWMPANSDMLTVYVENCIYSEPIRLAEWQLFYFVLADNLLHGKTQSITVRLPCPHIPYSQAPHEIPVRRSYIYPSPYSPPTPNSKKRRKRKVNSTGFPASTQSANVHYMVNNTYQGAKICISTSYPRLGLSPASATMASTLYTPPIHPFTLYPLPLHPSPPLSISAPHIKQIHITNPRVILLFSHFPTPTQLNN